MSRNEERTAGTPAAKTNFPGGRGGRRCHPRAGSLTCRGAGPGDSGEKRGDRKQQEQAPAARVPPARGGGGREGEAGGRAEGPSDRGAGKRVLPWRHLAGLPSPRRHRAPGCALAAARPSCGEQRRRWAAAAGSLVAPLSHPRSETRLRRALRSPARRAAPTSASGAALTPRGSPPPPPPSPRPSPHFDGRALPAVAATGTALCNLREKPHSRAPLGTRGSASLPL